MFKRIVRSLVPRSWLVRVRGWTAPGCRRGRHVYVARGVQMIGAAHVAIGDHSCISERTWINVNRRQGGAIEVAIGDNCFIGRDNFFSSGAAITIGHYTLTTVGCRFICSSHLIDDPLVPYLSSGTTADQAIRIGANCFFGAGSSVVGNVSVGHGSVIGAGAQVTADVPPFSIVIGSPARVVKRYSFGQGAWIAQQDVEGEAQLGYPDEEAYLQRLRHALPAIEMPLVAASAHFGNM